MYEGGFSSGEFEGEGLYKWPDGRSYFGRWEHGLMHLGNVNEETNAREFRDIMGELFKVLVTPIFTFVGGLKENE